MSEVSRRHIRHLLKGGAEGRNDLQLEVQECEAGMAKQKTRKRSFKRTRDEVLKALESAPISISGVTPLETTRPPVTMLEVLERKNMQMALKRVLSNKGCAGADGMRLEDLPNFLKENWLEIRAALLDGSYKPGVIKRAYIPKRDGSKRGLGIPSVLDRLIQQAIAQKLSDLYEKVFSEHSFGFRPGRSCHQAIEQSRRYVTEGYEHVVDMDLEKFFDKVNHERLMSTLSNRLDDKVLLKLVHSYLKAGILEGGLTTSPESGMPQGGPLSPILSNIVLDELDKELEKRGHKFVRYADDCNIFTRSERAAERVMESITGFVEDHLRLKVNREKSQVGKVETRAFLSFTVTPNETGPKIGIAPAALKRFKNKIREMTRKSLSLEGTIRMISRYLQGWMGYFGYADSASVFKRMDQWIRRRLRMLHLKRWRKPRTRYSNFTKLGMTRNDAMFLIRTTKRYWYLSKTSAVNRTLNLKYFRDLNLFSLESSYLGRKVN